MDISKSNALRALALVGAAFAVGACDSGGTMATTSEVATLRSQVTEAQRKNEQLIGRLDRMERRVEGLTQDIDRLSHERVRADMADVTAAAAATDGDEGEPGAAAMSNTSQPTPQELVDLLGSEQGKELVADAMRAVEERRDADRRNRMVSMMVDRFAEEANLTPQQTEDASRIVADSMQKMGDIWSSMRNVGEMTAEQRAQLRDENMVKMEEVRETTSTEMKAILNSEQYSIYEEQANRMRGWGGGGRGRGR